MEFFPSLDVWKLPCMNLFGYVTTSPGTLFACTLQKHSLFFINLRKIFRAGDIVFLPNAFIILHENNKTLFS